MALAGAGFVPCEVAYPARVLTAYPCVVRRDPTVCGTFPFGEQIGKVSLGGWEKNRGPNARALCLALPTPWGPHATFASERGRTCEDDGAAGLCTCHEGRGPGLRNLVRHEAGPCESHGKCYRSTHPRPNHVTTSGGHALANPPIEGPGEKRTHGRCIGRPHAPPSQPRPRLLANEECPHQCSNAKSLNVQVRPATLTAVKRSMFR